VRVLIVAVGAAVAVAAATALSGSQHTRRASDDWPSSNHDLASTRAVVNSPIDSRSVSRLRPVWRFRFRIRPRESGVFTSNPVVIGDTVYVQDMESNVFALDRGTGRVRWERRFAFGTPGPNGVAVDRDRVYGSTDTSPFALSRATGRLLWSRRILTDLEHFVDIAPIVSYGVVYTGTVGYPPGGKGAAYGLDANTGAIRWKTWLVNGDWAVPEEAGGGGVWFPFSLDAGGRVYLGTSNPVPWGGTRAHPNGGAFAGPALYTDSLVVLDARTGRLAWYDQVTPHDVRDYDFQSSPILATVRGRDVVIGAGKAGRVIAWDRETHERIWEAIVGVHRNDTGPLPFRPVTVCPGVLGGVETPMAYVGGRVFVPIVDLCFRGSAVGYQRLEDVDVSRGRGQLVALDAETGRPLWRRRLPQPTFGCATVANDVVFASTLDGRFYAFRTDDGRKLWETRMRAGINACPAVAGDLVLVGAGVPLGSASTLELVAFGLD
jgi:outer membrane protein assembly factor BamB